MTKNRYFAASEPKDLINALRGAHQSWAVMVGSTNDYGLGAVWDRNVRAYYAPLIEGSGAETSLGFGGEMGEIVKMSVPQARSLNTQFLSITTKQRLNFEPLAETTDALTVANSQMASAICQMTQREQKLDAKAYQMAEMASLMGSSFLYTRWDPLKGRKMGVDPETGELIYNGALSISVLSIYDVRFDYNVPFFYDQNWVEVRTLVNRHDLVAKYPHLEDEILKIPAARADRTQRAVWQELTADDMVYVYEFFHRSTPALEDGRYIAYISADAWLFDVENPYKDPDGQAYLPVAEMRPEPIVATAFGYPIFSNILPLQEMLDFNFAAQATNNAAAAIRSIVNPTDNDISVRQIGNMKFISYKPDPRLAAGGKPEVLDLNAPNTESYRFNDIVKANMMEIYNINAALRGEPPAGVTSGTAIATLSTNAIEFSQNFTKSYVDALETALTHSIWCYRNFGDEEMLVSMAGPASTQIAKRFKRDALAPFKRIKAQIANPLMATAAGKLEIAQNLLQSGLIKSANRYFRVLEGAPSKDLYENEYDQEQFIREENEELRKHQDEGPMGVYALATDDHPEHLRAHASLLDSLEIRNDPERRARIEQHIFDHYQLARETDPVLLQMIKTGAVPGGGMPEKGAGGAADMPPPGIVEGEAQGAKPAEPPASVKNPDMGGMTPALPM